MEIKATTEKLYWKIKAGDEFIYGATNVGQTTSSNGVIELVLEREYLENNKEEEI